MADDTITRLATYAIGICPACQRQQLQGDYDPYCYCLANEAGGWKATRFRLVPVALRDSDPTEEDR